MKTIAAYSTPAEAHVVLSRLTSAGIDAAIRDEFTIMFDWLYSNAIGGVKIEVADEDVAAARDILALSPSEPGLLSCPFCGSTTTSVRVLSVAASACILLNLPIPMTRVIVDCHACGKTHDVARNGHRDTSP